MMHQPRQGLRDPQEPVLVHALMKRRIPEKCRTGGRSGKMQVRGQLRRLLAVVTIEDWTTSALYRHAMADRLEGSSSRLYREGDAYGGTQYWRTAKSPSAAILPHAWTIHHGAEVVQFRHRISAVMVRLGLCEDLANVEGLSGLKLGRGGVVYFVRAESCRTPIRYRVWLVLSQRSPQSSRRHQQVFRIILMSIDLCTAYISICICDEYDTGRPQCCKAKVEPRHGSIRNCAAQHAHVQRQSL